jgi:hypothetical protein
MTTSCLAAFSVHASGSDCSLMDLDPLGDTQAQAVSGATCQLQSLHNSAKL